MNATPNATAGTLDNSGTKNDIFVAFGVVACLALGASLTYYLNSAGSPKKRARVGPVQGELLTAAVSKPASAENKAAPLAAAANSNPDFLSLGFDTLAGYYYELPTNDGETLTLKDPQLAPPKEQIPAPIKALTAKKVAVQGFMVPVKIEKGATKQFLLVKDQSLCCFGRMPRMNEWVSVKMSGDRSTKFIGDQPVTVFGTLSVGEEIEKGEVLSIYRMEADDVAGPLDL
jgi:hypothetical protein